MSGAWSQANSIKRKTGGTRTGWDAASIFEKVLNGRQLVVYDTVIDEDGKKKSVVNRDDTQAAERIGASMRTEFQEWLFEDKTRSEYLTKTFNEQFNSYVTPKYDGSKLTIKGFAPGMELRPHQKNAVQRMLMSGGNTLLAHCVGAGKTAVVASTVMKLREVGAIKRPLIIARKVLSLSGVQNSRSSSLPQTFLLQTQRISAKISALFLLPISGTATMTPSL